jgi:hypothetical protein
MFLASRRFYASKAPRLRHLKEVFPTQYTNPGPASAQARLSLSIPRWTLSFAGRGGGRAYRQIPGEGEPGRIKTAAGIRENAENPPCGCTPGTSAPAVPLETDREDDGGITPSLSGAYQEKVILFHVTSYVSIIKRRNVHIRSCSRVSMKDISCASRCDAHKFVYMIILPSAIAGQKTKALHRLPSLLNQVPRKPDQSVHYRIGSCRKLAL